MEGNDIEISSINIPQGYVRGFVAPCRRDNLAHVLAACLHEIGVPVAIGDLGNDVSLQAVANKFRVCFKLLGSNGSIDVFGNEVPGRICHIIRFNYGGQEHWQYDALFPSFVQRFDTVDLQPIRQSGILETLFDGKTALAPLPAGMSLVKLLEPRNVRVGLVGEFETGKSALLNALVGGVLVPEGTAGATTLVPTCVYYNDIDVIRVRFVPFPWEEVDAMIAFAARVHCAKREKGQKLQSMIPWVEALIGKKISLVDWPRGAEEDEKRFAKFIYDNIRKDLRDLLDSRRSKKEEFTSLSDASRRLANELKLPDVGTSGKDVVPGLWPVLKMVRISGRFPNIPRHVELLDLAGLNDSNSYRIRGTRDLVSTCQHIFLLTTGKAALGNVFADDFLDNFLEARLRAGFTQFTVIATHMDVIPDAVWPTKGPEPSFASMFWKYASIVENVIRQNLAASVCTLLERPQRAFQDVEAVFERQLQEFDRRRSLDSTDTDASSPHTPFVHHEDNAPSSHDYLPVAQGFVSLIPIIPTSARGFRAFSDPPDSRLKKESKFTSAELTGLPAVIRILNRLSEAGDPVMNVRWLIGYSQLRLGLQSIPVEAVKTIAEEMKRLEAIVFNNLETAQSAVDHLRINFKHDAQQSAVQFDWVYHDIIWFTNNPSSFRCALRGHGRWFCGGRHARQIDLNAEAVHFLLPRLHESFVKLVATVESHPEAVESMLFQVLERCGIPLSSNTIRQCYTNSLLAELQAFKDFRENITNEVKLLCEPNYLKADSFNVNLWIDRLVRDIFPLLVRRMAAFLSSIRQLCEREDQAVQELLVRGNNVDATRTALEQLIKLFEAATRNQ
jgi:hypothetical protein